MVIRILFFFILAAGLVTGCRTYVGYDPIRKTESRTFRENAVMEHSRYGVNCKWDWDQTVLTFGSVATLSYHRETREWETGKMEYFVTAAEEKQHDPVSESLARVILWPFLLIDDTLHMTSSWHLRECSPGIYTAAYLPPMSWVLAPFLRPPYASDFPQNPPLEKKTVKYASSKLKTIRITPIREECFMPDKTLSVVELRYGGKTIVKKLNSRGQLVFSLFELEPKGVFPPRMLDFQIYHQERNETWQVKIFSLCTPRLLRDWNLVIDRKFDFYSKFFALFRLKKVLGEKAYCDLTNQLIQGKRLSLSSCPAGRAEIHLISQQP